MLFFNYPTQLLKGPTPRSEYLNNPDCSELCMFTSCTFSSYIISPSLILLFFPSLNSSNQHSVQYKSTRAATPSSDQQCLSEASHPPEAAALSSPSLGGHVGKVLCRDTPGKAQSGTRQHLQASHLWDWGVLSVLSLLFSSFFTDWVTIFSNQVGSGHVHNSCLWERHPVCSWNTCF